MWERYQRLNYKDGLQAVLFTHLVKGGGKDEEMDEGAARRSKASLSKITCTA